MRIASVRIQNLRSFKDQTVEFDPFTCLVGPNGAGKSNVFCALNIFFGEDGHSQTDLAALEEEDFHNRDTTEPIRITVTFVDLSDAAKEDLKAYVRQERLVVSAVAEWDPEKGVAPVRQVGERLVMRRFARYFQAEKAKVPVAELKTIFAELRAEYPEVKAASTKEPMREALQEFEGAHTELCELVESTDQFYGVSKGDHLLNKHVQWVFIPAVKDAISEYREAKDSALGKLLARTVRTRVSFKDKLAAVKEEATEKYQAILAENQGALNEISTKLSESLAQWATPDSGMNLVWHGDKDKSIQVQDPYAEIVARDGGFSGALTRFGHGLQRSYLLALLQMIASGDEEGDVPTLILGCEEPELFQHPPQTRHLAEVLFRLAETGSQVSICTHSPLFVRGEYFESVRLIQRDPTTKASTVSQCLATDVEGAITTARGKAPLKREPAIAKLEQELNPELSEMFFAPYIVLVEGREDMAYIKAHLIKLDLMDRFRAIGCHIIPAHKKSQLLRPTAILEKIGIPFFCVFDADGDCEERHRTTHESENKALLSLLGKADAQPLPAETYWSDNTVVWASCLTKVIAAEFGADTWKAALDKVRAENGCPPEIEKNAHFIPDFLEVVWGKGLSSPSAEKLCRFILADAEHRLPRPTTAPTKVKIVEASGAQA